jgi:hypothetical protein
MENSVRHDIDHAANVAGKEASHVGFGGRQCAIDVDVAKTALWGVIITFFMSQKAVGNVVLDSMQYCVKWIHRILADGTYDTSKFLCWLGKV